MSHVIVKPLFRGPQYQTTVWVSEEVAEVIAEYLKDGGDDAADYIAKVEYYAKAGFPRHEGKKQGIRSKWDSILAIEPWATLFRLYGFYAQAQKKDFIIVSSTMKKGMKMSKHDKDEVDYAAKIRTGALWKKEEPKQDDPTKDKLG